MAWSRASPGVKAATPGVYQSVLASISAVRGRRFPRSSSSWPDRRQDCGECRWPGRAGYDPWSGQSGDVSEPVPVLNIRQLRLGHDAMAERRSRGPGPRRRHFRHRRTIPYFDNSAYKARGGRRNQVLFRKVERRIAGPGDDVIFCLQHPDGGECPATADVGLISHWGHIVSRRQVGDSRRRGDSRCRQAGGARIIPPVETGLCLRPARQGGQNEQAPPKPAAKPGCRRLRLKLMVRAPSETRLLIRQRAANLSRDKNLGEWLSVSEPRQERTRASTTSVRMLTLPRRSERKTASAGRIE